MKQLLPFFCVLWLLSCTGKEEKSTILRASYGFPSYDSSYPPPPNTANVFDLSQTYPDTFDINEPRPWEGIDFKTDYKKYMKSVLDYCLEGNVEVDFKVQDNKKRKWYHAPWLTYGMNGREFHHGLTRERDLPAGELLSQQNVDLENWAIGFYNAPGGYTIGKVWDPMVKPGSALVSFPDGTVSFKLLFTAGPIDKIPFLAGSKEWTANVFRCNPDSRSLSPQEKAVCLKQRYDTTVRLLQIDIAIKDKRAEPTGWVFGTFIYDGSQNGKSVWERMVPVGLMWGDDQSDTVMMNRAGAFINPTLKETLLNKDLIIQQDLSKGQKAYITHHGLGGRLNGPVDNPISSCISCHSKAANQANGTPAPMADFSLTRATYNLQAFKTYFATVSGGSGTLSIAGKDYNKLDYSLQLSAGIRNYFQSIIDSTRKANLKVGGANGAGTHSIAAPVDTLKDLPEVTRNGLIKD